jgi:hypothetical protein
MKKEKTSENAPKKMKAERKEGGATGKEIGRNFSNQPHKNPQGQAEGANGSFRFNFQKSKNERGTTKRDHKTNYKKRHTGQLKVN